MEYLYSLTVALFLTIALIPLLIRFSARLGLVDAPGAERKLHKEVMPRTGGLALICGVFFPLAFLLDFDVYHLKLFLACAIIVVFGLQDDRVELNYKWKLFGQSLAAIVVMSAGIVIHQFPFFGLSDAPVWLSYPVTFVFLVGVTNGVNFSDGLDGLAAGTSMMALLLISALALQSGNGDVALISITVVGGILGFLRYNTFPARIFMGDAGSQFLGFNIAYLAIAVTQVDISPYSAFLPVLILGIPIMDILQVVLVRIYKKLPLPGPDKEHFHHQLVKLGIRHYEVVAYIYLLQTALLTAAFLLRYQSDYLIALFYFWFVVTVMGAIFYANITGWRLHSGKGDSAGFERRNLLLRKFGWFYRDSTLVISLMLGLFLFAAGWQLSADTGSIFAALAVLLLALVVSLLLANYSRATEVFRILLYTSSTFITYLLVQTGLEQQFKYWVTGYLLSLLFVLILAIRMTRREEFSLTTQDLLILLIVILSPLAPFDLLDKYAVGWMALVVAVLMYASEFLLNRGSRSVAVAVAVAGAIAGLTLVGISSF